MAGIGVGVEREYRPRRVVGQGGKARLGGLLLWNAQLTEDRNFVYEKEIAKLFVSGVRQRS